MSIKLDVGILTGLLFASCCLQLEHSRITWPPQKSLVTGQQSVHRKPWSTKTSETSKSTTRRWTDLKPLIIKLVLNFVNGGSSVSVKAASRQQNLFESMVCIDGVKFYSKSPQQQASDASGGFMMSWQTQRSFWGKCHSRHWDPGDPDSSEDDRSGSVLTNPATREWQQLLQYDTGIYS